MQRSTRTAPRIAVHLALALAGLPLALALAKTRPDTLTFNCTYPHAPLDPHSIAIDLSRAAVTEIYPDPNAPANFTLINAQPDKNGDVLHLTVTKSTIVIDISNPDPLKAADDLTEQINRATGVTTVAVQKSFVGTGQCTQSTR